MPRFLLPVVLALAAAAPASAAGPALYPWPSNAYTKGDPTTDTGRRLNLQLTQMPVNAAGVPIDPTAINRNDGFSPGTLIVDQIPGLDSQKAFDRNGFPTNTDPSRSFDADAPVVVMDATAPKHPRWLLWAEMEYPADFTDASETSQVTNSGKTIASQQTLIVHPGRNFIEGHRYIVVLRHLVDADGKPIPAAAPVPAKLAKTLDKAGIDTGPGAHIYRAWDFTVASERNLSERMLHIRNDAFAQLGDDNLADVKVAGKSPTFQVYPDLPDDQVSSAPSLPEVGNEAQNLDGVTHFTEAQNSKLLEIVRGRLLVPCYLTTPECAEGGSFNYGPDGLPQQIPGNMAAAPFVCIVPRSVLTRGPARPTLYGHGLLGSANEVTGGTQQNLAFEQNLMLCATDWSGMSSEDLPNDVAILADLSHFDSLADRGQQGMLNFLYLGRALIHPQGMSTDPAFQSGGKSLIDTSHLYYDGGSQGGIMGGSLTAVAPDFTRAALGVPGMNYSVLLQRSVDFDTYAQVMYNAYPDLLQRPLMLSLIQLLWDRAEADGYAEHMTTDAYPDTPAHQVLLGMAYGDHQVSNWTTIVEARTIGAKVRTPIVDPSRIEDDMFYGIEPITQYPFGGPELVVADVGPLRQVGTATKGTPPPPVGNEPNRPGVDPHGPDESEQVYYRTLVGGFLQPDDVSALQPICDDHPCYLDGWDGTP
jgi:hypothetical protein